MNSGNSLIDQSATTPLLEQFPLLAASPNGINRLRELIIQLALKGKLGTNNHRDEPASVLLEQILSRKRDNKKSRQAVEKDLNDSSTYSVPSNWIWTKLFNIIEDAQPGFACGERDSQGIVQLRMNNINPRGDFVWEKILRVPFDDTLKLKYELKNGDIVFNNTNSLELVGKSAVFKGFSEPIVFSNHFTRLRVIEGLIDPAYVTIWLHGQWNSKIFEKICNKWIGQAAVNRNKLLNFDFPLPPLAEQHRIVEKVDRLMALCDTLEVQQRKEHEWRVRHGTAALTALQNAEDTEELEKRWRHIEENFDPITSSLECIISLKETIVQLAVLGKLNTQNITDEPSSAILDQIKNEFPLNYKNKPRINDVPKKFSETIPDNWQLISIEYLGEKIVDCPHSTPIFGGGTFACIDTNCINNKGIINEKLRYVDYETFNSRNRRLKPQVGDIVLAREATVGTAVVLPKFPEVCLGQRVMLIRPVRYLDSLFVRLGLSSNVVKQQYLPKLIGSTVPHLNVGDVVKLIIPLPPLAEQHRIVAKVDTLMALCDKLEAQIREREAAQERFAKATINQVVNAPLSTIQT